MTRPKAISEHLAHRRSREQDIMHALGAQARDIGSIVRAIYTHLPETMYGAAALSVYAHLQDLHGRGLVRADPALSLGAVYASNQAVLNI